MGEPSVGTTAAEEAACARIRLCRAEAAEETLERGRGARLLWWVGRRGYSFAAGRVGEKLGVQGLSCERTPSLPIRAHPVPHREDEVLGLRPGQVVEVKSAEEILETLDEQGAFRGLFFMQEMWRFCGERLVVMKVLDKLMVETTGTLRTGIKNTVLLAGAACDGSGNGDCAANCYHMWREVWLKRPLDTLQETPGQ